MVDPIVPLVDRSLRFSDGMFQATANVGDVTRYLREARTARTAVETSSHPLLCTARAAWWAAVADQCAAARAGQVERVES